MNACLIQSEEYRDGMSWPHFYALGNPDDFFYADFHTLAPILDDLKFLQDTLQIKPETAVVEARAMTSLKGALFKAGSEGLHFQLNIQSLESDIVGGIRYALNDLKHIFLIEPGTLLLDNESYTITDEAIVFARDNNLYCYGIELPKEKYYLVEIESPENDITELTEINEECIPDEKQRSLITEDSSGCDKEIFMVVEDMPQFRGGNLQNFIQYIQQNLTYPEEAIAQQIMGKVFVQFTVNCKGEVVNAVVLRGVDPLLDREALRVVNASPLWTPGQQRGRKINVAYTISVPFYLQ
jgi:TonB family protein